MKQAVSIIFLLLLFACSTNDTEKSGIQNGPALAVDSSSQPSLTNNTNPDAIWAYRFDSTLNDFKPVKLRAVLADTLSPDIICSILNVSWPDVQTKITKISKDTIFISIPDSDYLTQQMGTTGAQEYLVSATFSFTEVKGIQHVSFNFAEGDHAVPGVYDRNAWNMQIQ